MEVLPIGELLKTPFFPLFHELAKKESPAQSNIQKSQFSIEIFECYSRLDFPFFPIHKRDEKVEFSKVGQLYVELGQLCLQSLRPTFKHLNFKSMNELQKKGDFTQNKAGHILNLTQCVRYSISSNFKNLSINWEKYIFHYWEKTEF